MQLNRNNAIAKMAQSVEVVVLVHGIDSPLGCTRTRTLTYTHTLITHAHAFSPTIKIEGSGKDMSYLEEQLKATHQFAEVVCECSFLVQCVCVDVDVVVHVAVAGVCCEHRPHFGWCRHRWEASSTRGATYTRTQPNTAPVLHISHAHARAYPPQEHSPSQPEA